MKKDNINKLYRNEFSHEQILNMNNEDFNNLSPFEIRRCYDCYYLKSFVSWWCTNEEAMKSYGTSIPGGIKCEFWKPNKKVDKEFTSIPMVLTIEIRSVKFKINIKSRFINRLLFSFFLKFGNTI